MKKWFLSFCSQQQRAHADYLKPIEEHFHDIYKPLRRCSLGEALEKRVQFGKHP